MKILDRRNMGQYVLFFDDGDELRAGKIYDMENSNLSVHSLRINSRGVSKLYYYNLKESEILKFVTKECALHFVNKENARMIKMTDYLSTESKKRIKKVLFELKNHIDLTLQTKYLNDYDDSLDRFYLDELDYKILATLLSKSTFTSLEERTTGITLTEVVGSLFSAPSIFDYYSVLIRLYHLRETKYSISKYKGGTIKMGEFYDIFEKDFSFQTNWTFIRDIRFPNSAPGEVFLMIRLNITSYIAMLKILIEENSIENTNMFSMNSKPLTEYVLKRMTSELVANSDSLIFGFEEFEHIEFFERHADEQIEEVFISAVKELCAETSIEVEYRYKNNAIELKLYQIAKFNKRFFNHSDNCVEVGDFIKNLSKMISPGE